MIQSYKEYREELELIDSLSETIANLIEQDAADEDIISKVKENFDIDLDVDAILDDINESGADAEHKVHTGTPQKSIKDKLKDHFTRNKGKYAIAAGALGGALAYKVGKTSGIRKVIHDGIDNANNMANNR